MCGFGSARWRALWLLSGTGWKLAVVVVVVVIAEREMPLLRCVVGCIRSCGCLAQKVALLSDVGLWRLVCSPCGGVGVGQVNAATVNGLSDCR